jgi:hypothetical protein
MFGKESNLKPALRLKFRCRYRVSYQYEYPVHSPPPPVIKKWAVFLKSAIGTCKNKTFKEPYSVIIFSDVTRMAQLLNTFLYILI